MKIILCDKNKLVIDACTLLNINTDDDVQIINGDIFEQEFDAIATPSNSFGFMDGNFDYLITQKYGSEPQKFIKEYVNNEGEILVGQVCVMPRKECGICLLVAPTMRVPLDIQNTVNVYLALKQVFSCAKKENVKILALPAFGTGCGRLRPDVFAKQFKAAIEHYKKPPQYKTWQEAQYEHYKLIG